MRAHATNWATSSIAPLAQSHAVSREIEASRRDISGEAPICAPSVQALRGTIRGAARKHGLPLWTTRRPGTIVVFPTPAWQPLSARRHPARQPKANKSPAMDETQVTRRDAIKRAALAGLFLPLMGAVPDLGAEDAPAGKDAAGLRLGLVGYSLRKFSIDDAIAVLKELQITSTSVFRVHVPIGLSTPDVCRAMAQKFRDAGISIASTGVVYLKNSEGEMRQAFECGKAA